MQEAYGSAFDTLPGFLIFLPSLNEGLDVPGDTVIAR